MRKREKKLRMRENELVTEGESNIMDVQSHGVDAPSPSFRS